MEAAVNPKTLSLPVEQASGARANCSGGQFSRGQAACADLQSVWGAPVDLRGEEELLAGRADAEEGSGGFGRSGLAACRTSSFS